MAAECCAKTLLPKLLRNMSAIRQATEKHGGHEGHANKKGPHAHPVALPEEYVLHDPMMLLMLPEVWTVLAYNQLNME